MKPDEIYMSTWHAPVCARASKAIFLSLSFCFRLFHLATSWIAFRDAIESHEIYGHDDDNAKRHRECHMYGFSLSRSETTCLVIWLTAESAVMGRDRWGRGSNKKKRRKEKTKRNRGYSVFYIYHMTALTLNANFHLNVARKIAITACGIVGLG